MTYKHLLSQSKIYLEINPAEINGVISAEIFRLGAKWMFEKLNDSYTEENAQFNNSINYFNYGLLKYGISFFVFFYSLILFIKISLFLVPLSVLLFYVTEVHFLFLFPMLIDNIKKPVWTSIKKTYKTGILTALITIIPIGFYMVLGLLNFKNPFRNWYIGCLSVIIWYKNEIRNRI